MYNIKRELVKFAKLIYSDKFVIGAGGNISARHGRKVFIKATGTSLRDSREADYNEIDLKTGKVICFNGACSIEAPMHIACYKARHDIGAVIHTHPVYGTIMGMAGAKLGYISYEFMLAMRSEVPVINYKMAGSQALAKDVGTKIKKYNGLLLKNHGIIVVGKSLEEAYLRALALERACKIYLFSKLTGNRASFIPRSHLLKY